MVFCFHPAFGYDEGPGASPKRQSVILTIQAKTQAFKTLGVRLLARIIFQAVSIEGALLIPLVAFSPLKDLAGCVGRLAAALSPNRRR